MKVLDLECPQAHIFEGWFASEAQYLDQRVQGMVQCPVCGSCEVHKKLSAPRLNLSQQSGQSPSTPSSTPVPANAEAREIEKLWLEISKVLVANTVDVGEKFVQEARKIHYGEVEERAIRGKASLEDAQALVEEGIAVLPVLLPDHLKKPLH